MNDENLMNESRERMAINALESVFSKPRDLMVRFFRLTISWESTSWIRSSSIVFSRVIFFCLLTWIRVMEQE